jgi:hypothetical protein
MSSEPTSQPSGEPQKRQLNLQQMAVQYMAGVQRHLDLLAFNLVGQNSATESAYRARAELPQLRRLVNPLGNFEQLQAFARDILTRSTIGDAANMAVSGLHNAHLFLALIKGTGGAEAEAVDPEVQKAAQESHQAFVRAPLDQKFNSLEENFGVLCPLEDTIISYGMAMQAIMQNNGVVQKQHLGDDGKLTFELQSAPATAFDSKDAWFDSVETHVKTFSEGDRIAFTDTELQLLVFTVAVFGHQLFSSITRYARELKGGTQA